MLSARLPLLVVVLRPHLHLHLLLLVTGARGRQHTVG
jgi:hypothetical protein